MPNCIFGKIIRIDLTSRKYHYEDINPADVEKYFLGSGYAALKLYGTDYEGLDPLSPESPVYMMAGLFVGSPIPGTPKFTVSSKSPLTGIWNEATVGGHWPSEFRFTGNDGMIIEGRSDSPVYLYITEAGVEFRDAAHLWGKDTYETGSLLSAEIDPKAKLACIGQAGENLSPISSIIFDPPITRVAARGGTGAVWGSKNLKAIAVRGTKKLEYFDFDGLRELLKTDIPLVKEFTQGLHNFGTSGGVEAVEMYGDLPIKNWLLGSYKEGAKKISGQAMQPVYLDKHYACFACPIRCGKIYKVPEKGLYGHGPEYETIGMLGANCLNDDPLLLIEANELCNRYGIDTISGGAGVAFAMEAFEKGIITEKDTGGLKISWGGESAVALVNKMGRNEDIGKVLLKGVKKAAELIGGNSSEFAVHTKGMEYPAHDPRGHVGMALNYATGVRGACHLEGLTYFYDRGIPMADFGYITPPNPHDSSDKPPIVVNYQNYLATFNPLGMCKFLFVGRVGPKMVARWLEKATGWEFDMDKLMKTGERLFNLKRMYNVKLGISRKDDVLPPRLYAWGKPDGKAKDVLPDMGNMLYKYYKLRNWTEDGIPTPEKLEELGLSR